MDLPEAKLLTISQAGKILGISPKTLKRWEKAGKIKIPRTLTDRTLTVTNVQAGKFKVEVKQVDTQDIKFNWFVIN